MWIEKEDGWEVVLHSLMPGPSVPGPGPGGPYHGGCGRREDGTIEAKCATAPFFLKELTRWQAQVLRTTPSLLGMRHEGQDRERRKAQTGVRRCV